MAVLKTYPLSSGVKAKRRNRTAKKRKGQDRKTLPPTPSKRNDENIRLLARGVVTPLKNDILCGKDKSCVSHQGSVRFREVIEQYQELYTATTNKQEKMNITKEIVARFVGIARFLKFNQTDGSWDEIDELAARDKTTHALRFASHKARQKSGKGDVVRRRSKSETTGSNSPSPEETQLWNAFVARQKNLLGSIKKGGPLKVLSIVELSTPSPAFDMVEDSTVSEAASLEADESCEASIEDTLAEDDDLSKDEEFEDDEFTPLPFQKRDDTEEPWRQCQQSGSEFDKNLVIEYDGEDMSDDIASILSDPLIEFDPFCDSIYEV